MDMVFLIVGQSDMYFVADEAIQDISCGQVSSSPLR